MKMNFRVGVLGAGLSSRLKTSAGPKPLASLGGQSLLELMIGRFQRAGVSTITCALREELLSEEMRAALPRGPEISYLFVNTESSLHTLTELIQHLGPRAGAALFTMADTIMLPGDFERFLDFCAHLGPRENAVLLTPFVDDEKPLWAEVDARGYVTGFGSRPTQHVTSGMYFLQPEAMELAQAEVASGTHKMRNFLAKLAQGRHPIKSFVVPKTIDVDHPSDLEKASLFLLGN